jgi:hypothetical protein
MDTAGHFSQGKAQLPQMSSWIAQPQFIIIIIFFLLKNFFAFGRKTQVREEYEEFSIHQCRIKTGCVRRFQYINKFFYLAKFEILTMVNTQVKRTAGCDAVHSDKNLLIFRENLLPLTFPLKWEATGSSETAVNFYQTTQCHIPEYNNRYVLTYVSGCDFHGSTAVVTCHWHEMHKITSLQESRFLLFFASFLLSSVGFS